MAKPSAFPRSQSARLRGALAAACCGLAPWLAGCRAVDHAQVDVLERELRQQEDYIYELEDYLIEYSEKLRQCRMACQGTMEVTPSTDKRSAPTGEPTLADDSPRGQSSRRPSGRAGGGPLVAPSDAGGADAADAAPGPGVEPEPPVAPPPVDPQEMEVPELEFDPTSELEWQDAAPVATSPAVEAPAEDAPPYMPDPANYQLDAAPSATVDAEAAAPVADDLPQLAAPELTPAEPQLPPPADPARLAPARLHVRRLFAEPPAPEAGPEAPAAGSLLVVVEALNATDEPVDAGGAASLMVMAGEDPQSLERVDRWDFTAEETQASWQSSHLGDGLHLELPLGAGPLPEGPLELWVRVVQPDGEKLLARLPFDAAQLTSLAESPPEATAPVKSLPLTTTGAAEATPESSPAPAPATEQATPAAWRASSQPIGVERVEGFASTASAQSGGWTSQPPGGRATQPAAPRVANGPPRWQHGATEPTDASSEPKNAWAPFR